jgi:hypothetical protein
MSDLRIRDIAKTTGLSARYWQRRAMAGELPGASYVQFGERRTYLVDSVKFLAWWDKQKRAIPCQKISGSAAKHGGTESPKMDSRTKVRFKLEALDSLKNDLKEFAKS